jgi:hypothetical protein
MPALRRPHDLDEGELALPGVQVQGGLLRLAAARLPSGGTPAHHPLPSVTRQDARVSHAVCSTS